MASISTPLVVRSRVTPWGFLLALPLALAFAVVGVIALEESLLPRRLGIFIDPPPWLMGALLLGLALFLFLVGIAELARFLKPTVEAVLDERGIATYGLLGERRLAWEAIQSLDVVQGVIALKPPMRGRINIPDLRLDVARLAAEPGEIISRINAHRPDLLDGRAVWP
jgi:hypothetical protein